MTRTLIVDGTKEIIANGVSLRAHAISNSTDYTHQRIVGYAVTLEDAALFAAAEAMRDACAEAASRLHYSGDLFHDQGNESRAKADWAASEACAAAILKSEVR